MGANAIILPAKTTCLIWAKLVVVFAAAHIIEAKAKLVVGANAVILPAKTTCLTRANLMGVFAAAQIIAVKVKLGKSPIRE